MREELALELKNPGAEPCQTPHLPPDSSSAKSKIQKQQSRKERGYKQNSRNVYYPMLRLVATQLDVDAVAVRVEPVHQALQRLLLHRIQFFDRGSHNAVGGTSGCRVQTDDAAAALEQRV